MTGLVPATHEHEGPSSDPFRQPLRL